MRDETSETNLLRAAVSDALRTECPLDAVLRFAGEGGDLRERLWRLAAELGWFGVAAPESVGGSGLGLPVLLAIYGELGRHLAPIPFLQTQLVVDALIAADRMDSPDLERLAMGEVQGVVSLDRVDPLTARRKGSAIEVSAGSRLIVDAQSAGLFLLFAEDRGGHALALLAEATDLPALAPEPAHDATRTLSRLTLDRHPIPAERLLAEGAAAERLRQRLVDHAAIALAADAVGGASTIFDMTVEYLKTRRQFDRPIGSFQALKHRCATLRIRQRVAEASLLRAAEADGAEFERSSAAASIAKFEACDAYLAIAADAIQLHGGIGFTWENPCHLFLKRAKLDQTIFGNSAWHMDRVAKLYLEVA